MYKLLLAVDNEQLGNDLYEKIDWHAIGFHRPYLAYNEQEAVEALESKAIDAVGVSMGGADGKKLNRYLRYGRPSMPLFAVTEDSEEQAGIMTELRRILDKLHADDSDEYYDTETVMTMIRDDLTHQMLCGDIDDYGRVERTLDYLRSRLSKDGKVILYDIDMPQGEIYMWEHNNPEERRSRLESALRNNFFGRYVDDAYYAVAVVNLRHIRLAVIPAEGGEKDEEQFRRRADRHVKESCEMVRNYLDLDMNIERVTELKNLRALTELRLH